MTISERESQDPVPDAQGHEGAPQLGTFMIQTSLKS